MNRGPGTIQGTALEAIQQSAVILEALGLELTAQLKEKEKADDI